MQRNVTHFATQLVAAHPLISTIEWSRQSRLLNIALLMLGAMLVTIALASAFQQFLNGSSDSVQVAYLVTAAAMLITAAFNKRDAYGVAVWFALTMAFVVIPADYLLNGYSAGVLLYFVPVFLSSAIFLPWRGSFGGLIGVIVVIMICMLEENIRLLPELTAVVSSIQPIIDDKSVQIILDIDADLLPVVGDRRRIRQILLNLLSNAAKFTAHGSITLSARHQGDSLLFAVIDTGPGIAQAEVGLRHADGTGLGLPISKRLAEAHDGQLWVESEKSHGATFFVLLPSHSEWLLAAAGRQ